MKVIAHDVCEADVTIEQVAQYIHERHPDRSTLNPINPSSLEDDEQVSRMLASAIELMAAYEKRKPSEVLADVAPCRPLAPMA